MKKLSTKQADLYSARSRQDTPKKPNRFINAILQLKVGEAVMITPAEWTFKSIPTNYFHSLFRYRTEKVCVNKIGKDYVVKRVK